MTRLATLCGVLVLASSTVPVAQRLTDADIAEAISRGKAGDLKPLISDCVATASVGSFFSAGLTGDGRTGSYDVVVSTHIGRIAVMAADAARRYEDFDISDVEDDMRDPGLFVSVDPTRPQSVSNLPSLIDHVVLKSKAKSADVVQPITIAQFPVEFGNLFGATFDANRAVARFDYAAVTSMPDDDFDVVVITADGERRCKVGTKDQRRLFSS